MNKVTVFFWAMCFLLISACAAQKSQQETASDFWAAMMVNDIAKARTFAKHGSMDNITPKENAKLEKVEIRHAREANGLTYIPTTMIGMENGKVKRLTFDTVLEKEDGEWKVDFDKTSTSIMGVSMDAVMDGMGEATQGVGEAVGKGLQKAPLAP